MTLYGHLLETDVVVGNTVARGQRIGLEGSTGWSTGPHVHFELRINDAVVESETSTISLDHLDPMGMIKLSAGRKRHALVRTV